MGAQACNLNTGEAGRLEFKVTFDKKGGDQGGRQEALYQKEQRQLPRETVLESRSH